MSSQQVPDAGPCKFLFKEKKEIAASLVPQDEEGIIFAIDRCGKITML